MTRQDLIKHWYSWNNAKDRRPFDWDRTQREGLGLAFNSSLIQERNGQTLGVFVRRERLFDVHNDGFGNSTRRKSKDWVYSSDIIPRKPEMTSTLLPPLVRLVLPNVLTIGRHNVIWRTLERLGAQVVTVPARVLDAADIMESSIIVIDSEKRPRPFRARQQLIRAQVSPAWTSHTRWSYFLSGYDLNEPGLSYFFCELPPDAHPTTVEEAYQALKPESVKVAEMQGRKVHRQGDIFLIQMDKNWTPNEPGYGDEKAYVLGTNHQVDEKFFSDASQLTYARGRIVHAPRGRNPDHKKLHLGKRWHLVVKNTVPVVGIG